MKEQLDLLHDAAELVKAKNVKDVPARLEAMQQQVRQLQKDNESLSAKLGNLEAGNLVNEVIEIDGVAVLAKKVEASDMDGLRSNILSKSASRSNACQHHSPPMSMNGQHKLKS